jgi:hypothetical protein
MNANTFNRLTDPEYNRVYLIYALSDQALCGLLHVQHGKQNAAETRGAAKALLRKIAAELKATPGNAAMKDLHSKLLANAAFLRKGLGLA